MMIGRLCWVRRCLFYENRKCGSDPRALELAALLDDRPTTPPLPLPEDDHAQDLFNIQDTGRISSTSRIRRELGPISSLGSASSPRDLPRRAGSSKDIDAPTATRQFILLSSHLSFDDLPRRAGSSKDIEAPTATRQLILLSSHTSQEGCKVANTRSIPGRTGPMRRPAG